MNCRALLRGAQSERAFNHWAAQQGYVVVPPIGVERYDYVCIVDGEEIKVQVKSAHYDKRNRWHSSLVTHKRVQTYLEGDWDWLFVYGDDDTMWLMPHSAINMSARTLALGKMQEQYRVFFMEAVYESSGDDQDSTQHETPPTEGYAPEFADEAYPPLSNMHGRLRAMVARLQAHGV